MKQSDKYKKSLELMDKFIAETPKKKLKALIKKHSDTNIKGPTFDEYQKQFEQAMTLKY